jgi:WD40 repeat protein
MNGRTDGAGASKPAQERPMPLTAGARLGPYEVLELIGAGGMGSVYRARDPRLGRDVAIKVLKGELANRPDYLARFEREARAVAAINHPHILGIYDVGTDGDTAYVVTELLEGETWRELLDSRTPTARQMLAFARQAAHGLAAAHAKGIVHRDLKPENLFLTTDGRVKILDFGLAKETTLVAREAAVTMASPTQPHVLIGTPGYMAPEQIRAEPVDAGTDVFAFGVVLYEMLAGSHPFRRESVTAMLEAILHETPPPLTPGRFGIPQMTDAFLRRCLAKRREDRFADAGQLAQALDTLLQAPASAATLLDLEERSPYPGLRSFTEQDAAVFFGREEEVVALWARIRRRPLLAVIGPSGAGKTSFLRAGVVPARPDGWATVVCTPGTAPLRALGQALAPELTADVDALRQLVSFDDPDVAFTVLRRWRQAHGDALVVFDQFEELFTLSAPVTQVRVAALIERLTTEAGIHVVMSLRDDFLMRCHEHAPLAGVFSDLTPLGQLTRTSLRRALVEPGRKRGYRFEDEALVNEMVDCVEGARAALPLLAFAVSRLWELRDREQKVLTRAAYQQIGGVAGALAQHAEATLDRIGSMHQDLVRELFRNLVTAHGTRAVMDRDELLSAIPDRAAALHVLEQLVAARLLTSYQVEGKQGEPGGHRVEIVHESLLRAWPRLVRWQMQDEHGAHLRDQLRQAAHLWDEKGRTADLLWTGMAFEEYALWRQRYPGSLTALEEDFARAMAARVQRRKRLQRAAVAAVMIVLSVVALAIGVSRQQAAAARDSATLEARRAEASKLLALAELRFSEDPTEAALLAGVSLEQADTAEARDFLMKALWDAPLAFELVADQSVRVPAFSPDGRWLAAAGHLPAASVWSEDGRGPIVLPGLETTPRGSNVALWASNDMLVTGLFGEIASRVHVWSLPDSERLRTIEFDRPGTWQVGPGCLLMQTPGGESGLRRDLLLRSWQLPDGEAVILGNVDRAKLGSTRTFFEPDGRALLYAKDRDVFARALPVSTAADRRFDRLGAPLREHYSDLNRIVLGDESGEFRIWRYGRADGPDLRVIQRRGPPGTRMLPDPSGRWMIGDAFVDHEVRLWDPGAWAEAGPLHLRRSASWYGADVTAHPSGDWVVASTSRFTRLTFWPLGRPYARIVEGYSALGRPVAFSPDGNWVATSWGDGRLRLWSLPGNGRNHVRTLDLPGETQPAVWFALAFDPAARFLVGIGIGNRDQAWVVPLDESPPRRLEGFSEDTLLRAAAVSPTGRRVATAFYYGQGQRTLRVWDLETGTMNQFDLPGGKVLPKGANDTRQTDTAYDRGVIDLAFSDESTLYSAGDGGLRRWNLDSGTEQLLVASARGLRSTARFSRDGRLALLNDFDPSREKRRPARVYDTRAGTFQELPQAFGEVGCIDCTAIDPSGRVVAIGSVDGIVRLGRLDGGEPHILAGHKGAIANIAFSPDLRWVATTGEDNTLRLWPMPDLSKPPLHTLPLDQLLAKLRSLTNLRAVRDPASASGWRVEVGPFPGWKNVPTW